ncbi:hypothetical protein F2Q69_00003441 [Brassica cretica]|uniref:DUF7900 domain-containing protein n=1 Tax=Brassica cretica TaxID=69181 RepID=A0A8S9P3X8_BRACR|nr:hypothetical protein F2Q69_00003441 [Brassica cretica]
MRKNPRRRFLSCRGRRVGRDYVKCDFCQWFDLEPPHGWQHLALLEARDIINEQKEEIAKLRNQVRAWVTRAVGEIPSSKTLKLLNLIESQLE